MGNREKGRRSSLWAAVAVLIVAGTLSTVPGVWVGAVSDQTFTPKADAYVDASRPSKNFGRLRELRIDSSPLVVSYLRFDIEGLSGQVTSATLNLSTVNGSDVGFEVHAVQDTGWEERVINATNAPPYSAPVVASSRSFGKGVRKSLDVTSLVSGNGPVGVALTTSSPNAIYLGSREAGATGPELVVRTAFEDTSPPSVPTGLSAVAASDTRVDLSWSASSDDAAVSGYTVYRDDIELATVTGGATRYSDRTVAESTHYVYTVDAYDAAGNRSARSDPAAVTTPAPSADPVVVAVGNTVCDPADKAYNGGNGTATRCHHAATSDLAVAARPDAVLTLGDQQYDCGGYQAYTQAYDATWGRVKSLTHPSVGSHDYYNTADSASGTDCSTTRNAAGYFNYFGDAAGDPAKGYYSFDLGAWHIVSLNSNCWKVNCAVGSVQEQWLRQDLAASSARCTLAYWHHPRFSSRANNTSTDAFWRALHSAGADLVLTAHHHFYERFGPQDPSQQPDPHGIRQFIVATGGVGFSTFNTIQPNSEVRQNDTFGVLKLTLHSDSYDWEFLPEPGKTFTDSGTTACH